MGRGLSELQRWIVTEAARCPRLHYADVLHRFFCFGDSCDRRRCFGVQPADRKRKRTA
jgi:hypothetical protein